jgi:hypothetical protein
MTTRTRPKTLSASRRKRRPELECLEEKKVLSTVFGSYPSGTWAYNDQAGWLHLNEADPIAMKEGTDGTLFASYNNGPYQGTWRYDYGSNTWSELTSWTASVLSASGRDNTFFGTFSGNGTWEFNGSWHQLASHDATMLAAVANDDVYAVFTGDKTGTWHSKGGWNEITSAVPTVMDASRDGAMYASYSDGTWEYDGGWAKQTDHVAIAIAAISNNEFWGSFSSQSFSGTYFYFEGSVAYGTLNVASHLGHSPSTTSGEGDVTIVGSWSDGTWTYAEFGTPATVGWHHIDTDHAYMFG